MWRKVLLFVVVGLVLLGAGLWISTPDISSLAKSTPSETAFMRIRKVEAARRGRPFTLRHTWRSLGEISPHLLHAVIVSEDAAFYTHGGIDAEEILVSFKRNLAKRRLARGGSTITQQLAKNLYLSPSRNPVRKLREVMIALELEAHLSKDRIFELYLNSIEWGDGIFGAEAAARRYFGRSARGLTDEQAATLAAIIPSPARWGARLNSHVVQKRKRIILRRMRARFGGPVLRKPAPPEPTEIERPLPPEPAPLKRRLPTRAHQIGGKPAPPEPVIVERPVVPPPVPAEIDDADDLDDLPPPPED